MTIDTATVPAFSHAAVRDLRRNGTPADLQPGVFEPAAAREAIEAVVPGLAGSTTVCRGIPDALIPFATLIWEGPAIGVDPREHFAGVLDNGPHEVVRQVWGWGEADLAALPESRLAAAVGQLPDPGLCGEGFSWGPTRGQPSVDGPAAAEEVLARWGRGGRQPVPPGGAAVVTGEDWLCAGRRPAALDLPPGVALAECDELFISPEGEWGWAPFAGTPEGEVVLLQAKDVRVLQTRGIRVAGTLGRAVTCGLWLDDGRALRPSCEKGIEGWRDGANFVPFGAMR